MAVFAVKYSSMTVCLCVSASLWLGFTLRAGKNLECSHSNMFQNAYPPFPNKIWMHKRKRKKALLLFFPPSPLWMSAAPSSLVLCHQDLLQFFFFLSLLWRPHTPQTARVITVECGLLWPGLAALTGFGMGACRGSMRTSRQVVTRQRVTQCDRYYSVYTFSKDSLDVMIFEPSISLFLATYHKEGLNDLHEGTHQVTEHEFL